MSAVRIGEALERDMANYKASLRLLSTLQSG